MGFQYFGSRNMRCGYERLNQKLGRSTVGRCWMKSVNGGRLRGVRLNRCRKLSVKAFSAVLMSSRIVRLYTDIVNRMNLESVCPAIVLSTQWGLPVLSYSSATCRNSVIPVNKKVTCSY